MIMKAVICDAVIWLVLAGIAGRAYGQADPYLPCYFRGALVTQGEGAEPVGDLRVRGYRLEAGTRGDYCLSVTLDSRISGPYLIWIDDDARAAYATRTGELTASFPPQWIQPDAEISVSRYSTPYERTTLTQRLAVPATARLPAEEVPGSRMQITSLRRVTRIVAGAAQPFVVLEVTKQTPFEPRATNEGWVIQIGRKEFAAGSIDPRVLTCTMREEEFAALADGDRIRVNLGYGALAYGYAGKSFARLDKRMIVDGK